MGYTIMFRTLEVLGLFATTAVRALSVRVDAQTVVSAVTPDTQNDSGDWTLATDFENFQDVHTITAGL